MSRVIEPGDDPIHIVIAKIDLEKLKLELSPPDFNDPKLRYSAMATSDALKKYDGVLAVNASFFRPFRDKHLFDYYPHRGDPVEVIGRTIFNSVEHGLTSSWPTLFISDEKLTIYSAEDLPNSPAEKPQMAVSGKSQLVKNGVVTAESGGKRYPRTAVGINSAGTQLWLVVVDGKQPLHSEGVDLEKLAHLMVHMGVENAIELDGGGSSTMAAVCKGDIKVLNRPSHTKIPARERPVANHLIVKKR